MSETNEEKSEIEEQEDEEKNNEESDLEEDIETFEESKFQEFLNPSEESNVKVLEKDLSLEQRPISNLEELEDFSTSKKEEKTEEKYQTISQDYEELERKRFEENPNMAVRHSFSNIEDMDIVHNQIQRINPILEPSMRNDEGNLEKKYFNKMGEVKESKPHNPFEKQELKYDIS